MCMHTETGAQAGGRRQAGRRTDGLTDGKTERQYIQYIHQPARVTRFSFFWQEWLESQLGLVL